MNKYLSIFLITLMGSLVSGQVVYPPSGQSTYIISSGQNITVTDGQSITFGPGTHIQSGAIFTAKILLVNTADDPYSSISQSDENYVFTRNFQKAMSSFTTSSTLEGDVYERITYFDGLGRPIQQLGIKAAPDKKDIVTHIGYDDFGRQDKEWLPYHEPTGTLGTYRGDMASTTRSYYKTNYPEDFTSLSSGTANAYGEKDFEDSPLNRVLKQAAPGQDWRLGAGHEIEFDYEVNAANEVRLFTVDLTISNGIYMPSLSNDGHYVAGTLYKNVVKDENHSSGTDHTTEEFTDMQGRVVLKRTHNNGDHDTYYVYDDFGNLTYVLPPKVTTSSVSSTELNELCYQYRYDGRNRLAEKKLPGKGWESVVYNKLDQPIMTQDANQDSANEWLFTKYDAFGRVAYTGVDTGNSSSRNSVQNGADSESDQFETRTSGANTYAGTTVYYSKTAYPTSFNAVYTINYYDDYVDTDGLSVPSTVLGQTTTSDTQGLATVGKVRVLGTNDWITTITGYDAKGRVIYTASKNNYLNTTTIVETELDFGGKVLQTKTTHSRTGHTDVVTTDTFAYDHQGRLLRQTQTINGQSQETLLHNTYDNLGLLAQKTVGGGLQTVDYAYNVRGWLKSINDPGSLGSDLFAFGINYNTVAHSGTQLYNGNIAETEWRTANDNVQRWYRYGYDALNRINSATANSTNYHVSDITYDKNGNILTLKRKGHTNASATNFGMMDDLTYTYGANSNKLYNMLDEASTSQGFNDFLHGDTSVEEYTYDDNGNMVKDLNKGIGTVSTDGITYNHLNLPTSVVINNAQHNGTISYIYDATGVKQRKIVSTGTTTDYAGNYVYENNALQFFNHPEGYVAPDGTGGYEYVYQYKDHLGNVRLSYTDNNGILEIVEESNYYPFGLKHKGYNDGVSSLGNDVAQKWKYNGVELDETTGLYEMDLRQYDPAIARWTSIDPVTHYSASTYNAFDNNPIFFADPSGADSESFWQNVFRARDRDGQTLADLSGGDNFEESDGSNDNTSSESESNEDCCEEYIASLFHYKGPKETRYYKNNPDKEKIVLQAAYKAGVLATRVSNDLGGDNLGYSGAIRHSYWMYLIAVELGPELAERLGMLHEDYEITVGEHKGKNNLTTRDSQMDQVNNAFGILIARKNPNLTDLEFEDIFLKTVNHKDYQKLIKIFDTHTIPKESLKVKAERVKRMDERTFVRFGEF
ncbi:DUF6443 domain-containing protein [Allomuricauda sp. SCSIO 65647]|uniref:DUF6443 domain-containing protein n=1 Tax=Allomuricauda sp. SCSIO 65647 TaxID=2908843 RepID=UPI001F3E96E1|nr:DUF6443 domain-containing protein [Muricauda sp. SCSIO 65647]UJH68662.1 RHS repeat-associated core domain-containing protein [Muricauda sp. SCSIO 65647]